jgi:hypothetical protein
VVRKHLEALAVQLGAGLLHLRSKSVTLSVRQTLQALQKFHTQCLKDTTCVARVSPQCETVIHIFSNYLEALAVQRSAGQLHLCYKTVTLSGRHTLQALQKRRTQWHTDSTGVTKVSHTQCETDSTGVTKVSHLVADRQYRHYKSITLSGRHTLQALQKCHTQWQTDTMG